MCDVNVTATIVRNQSVDVRRQWYIGSFGPEVAGDVIFGRNVKDYPLLFGG